jgi:hypothetical protein
LILNLLNRIYADTVIIKWTLNNRTCVANGSDVIGSRKTIQMETTEKKRKKKTECVVKTHDRSETFVLQGNIVIIHQSLLNSIFTTKLYILMKKINDKRR